MRRNRVTVTTLAATMVVFVTTASLGTLGVINYLNQRHWGQRVLRAEATTEADELAAALALPLWNFDRAQVEKVIESQMRQRDIDTILVRQADASAPGGVVTYGRARDGRGEIAATHEQTPQSPDLYSEERWVTAGGDPIGSVRVYLTPRYVSADLRMNLMHLVATIVALDVLLSASLYLLLWRTVLGPLKAIEQYAAAVRGEATPPVEAVLPPPVPVLTGIYPCRELQSLRHSIAHMVRLLHARLAALRKNEAMLSTVLNTVPLSIFWKDANGVYQGCNDALAAMAGLRSRAEIAGKTDFDFPWGRECAEAFRAEDREVIESGRPMYHRAQRVPSADGNRRWVDATKVPLTDAANRICGVLGIAEDITDRKEAEDAFQRQKAFTEAVLDSIPGVLYLYDDQLRLIRWNERAEEVSGFSRDELLHRPAGAERPEADRAELRDAIDQVMRTGHGSIESYLMTKSGGRIPYYFTGVRLAIDGKQYLIGIGIDITDRKRAEEQMRRALDQAESANRAKDQFLAAASHELRTPLTPVLLLSSSLESDPHIPEDARQDLAVIREHVEVEKRLIGDLLDFTAIHAGKLNMRVTPTDIHDAMHAAIRTCQKDIERKGLRLDAHLDARHHHTNGDPDRLRQIFWNLLQNAVKFTPEGGSVTIRTSDDGAQSLRAEVADTGMGMSLETLQKLFRPFEQGPRETLQHYGGLGLGLAISKTLVEAHGGSISAMSDGTGHGSTFIVRLPVTVDAEAAGLPPSRLPPVPQARLRLLLVEDHILTLKTLRRLLAAEGHDVATATSVQEALDAAAAGRFDLVISDIGLPDGSGLDLMPQLRDRYGLSGIALSGFGSDRDLDASRRAGFVAHLTKPVTIEALRDALTRFAASRLAAAKAAADGKGAA